MISARIVRGVCFGNMIQCPRLLLPHGTCHDSSTSGLLRLGEAMTRQATDGTGLRLLALCATLAGSQRPDMLSNIIPDVSVTVFLDGVNI